MAILNRSLDSSEQNEKLEVYVKGTVTGANYVVGRVMRPCQIQSSKVYSAGLSGSPVGTLFVERFTPGTGSATYAVGTSLAHAAFGTSGIQSFSLPAAGSSLLDLQTGDVLRILTGAANTALTDLLVQVVVKNVGDIKGWS